MKRHTTWMLMIAMSGAVWFADGPVQAAEGWGLAGEKVVRFEAKVVDMLCELTGDCPKQCGGGERQLGLLTDSGELILAYKNVVPFAGAAGELVAFCGKRVTADGLMAHNRKHKIFALQFLREAPDGKWQRANRWLDKWAKDNNVSPKSKTAQQWFRNDPEIKRLIAEQGKLGVKGQ